MPTKCSVHNCSKPSVSKGFCDTHRKRIARHGSLEHTRPADWGAKEKHPKYKAWCGLRRHHLAALPASWAEDFWAFVADTPDKPEGRCAVARPDPSEPWSRDNFYWREPQLSLSKRADWAAYMRAYSKRARAANPDYHKSIFLRRKYGISVADYDRMLESQGGACAICAKPEKMAIRGTVVALAVDHDHDTGAVRALLCSACNTAIGLFNDDPKLLGAAKDYLAKHGRS